VAGVIRASVARELRGVAAVVTARADEVPLRAFYDEIDSEQQIFDVFALLIILGAGFAVFMLTRRIVEAQRREIGIAMAIGVPPPRIARRTVMFGVEIAILGVSLGVGTGWLIGTWVLSVIRAQAPLPYWSTPFPAGIFALAVLAALLSCPSRRRVASGVARRARVQPVEPSSPPTCAPDVHLPHAPAAAHPPARTIALQTPWRRIGGRRSVRCSPSSRIAFVMTPLLAAFGATDSVTLTVDAGERSSRGAPATARRPATGPPAVHHPLVGGNVGTPSVARPRSGSTPGAFVIRGGRELASRSAWATSTTRSPCHPTSRSSTWRTGGIVQSRKAASDLRVRRGDTVVLRHSDDPRPEASASATRACRSGPRRQPLSISGVHGSRRQRSWASRDRQHREAEAGGRRGDDGGEASRPRHEPAGARVARRPLPNHQALSPPPHDARHPQPSWGTSSSSCSSHRRARVPRAFNASNLGAEERSREHATMFASASGSGAWP